MSRIAPVDPDSLDAAARARLAAAEQLMGFVPNDALLLARVPGLLEAAGALVQAVYAERTVSRELKRLVGLVSSQASGCRYCQAHTAHGLLFGGAAKEKVEAAWDYERSPLFDEAERAALRLAWHAGLAPNAVEDRHFDDLRRFYNDDQLAEIVAVIALFGFLNRWNDTLATDLEARPRAAFDTLDTGR